MKIKAVALSLLFALISSQGLAAPVEGLIMITNDTRQPVDVMIMGILPNSPLAPINNCQIRASNINRSTPYQMEIYKGGICDFANSPIMNGLLPDVEFVVYNAGSQVIVCNSFGPQISTNVNMLDITYTNYVKKTIACNVISKPFP